MMRKSHPPPSHLVNGHFFTGGLWYLNGLLSNEFLSLYKCIPQPNDAWFGILDQSFAPAQRLVSSASERASRRVNGPALYVSISCNFYPECSGGGLEDSRWLRMRTMGRNCMKIMQFIDLKLFLMNSGASKQASE